MQLNSFWNKAASEPDRRGIAELNGRETTAGDLLAATNQLVRGLRARGLSKGDTVATVLPNCTEMIEVALACGQAGIYITPINDHLTAPEIAFILSDSCAKLVVCHPQFADKCSAALCEVDIPSERRFIVGNATGYRSYTELTAGQPSSAPENRAGGFAMTYTSGTTGQPRGVRRPTGDIDADMLAHSFSMFLKMFNIADEGTHLVVSPLYHTAVLNWCLYSLHLGHSIVLMEHWSPEDALAAIQKYQVTTTHMVPTHLVRLLGLPANIRSAYDLSSLTHMVHGAAPCPVEVKKQVLDWLGPIVYEYYAASEGGGTLATPKQWLERPGTVGAPWPISTISIRAEDGTELKAGEVGTVWIRMGDHKFEYHGDEKKTANAWNKQFFTVGDAGYLDDAGFLFLCDRKADMIISGGVNIYPAEIEGQLILHPAVADCAVFGIPDDDWGEQVMAVVQPEIGVASDDSLTESIHAFCGERLAKFKCPRTIEYLKELPRDPNGKLYKRKLRDPYWVGRDRQI